MKQSLQSPAFASLALLPAPSIAHGLLPDDTSPWMAWNLTLSITLPLAFIVLVYLRGWWKRSRRGKPASPGQALAFFLGMVCFHIALQSPIEPLSNHFLFIHQVEHLLLRVLGPLLTILAMPLAALIQGLPRSIRHHVLVPVVRNRVIQTLYGFFSHPLVAPLLFLATLIFWQVPSIHDLAVQDRLLHELMHLSMIVSGFFFWWLIADPRKTARLPLGIRLIALWVVTVPNTLLGAWITLAKSPLYNVYDVLQGRWDVDRLFDQQLGGLLIWGPGAMMGVIGTAVILFLWIRSDQTSSHPGKVNTAVT